MKRKLREIINEGKKYLQGDFTLEDIFWLIEEVFSLEKYQILLNQEEYYEENQIMPLIKRAIKEPVAYIVGHKKFYNYDFKVNNNVLIPRDETEELVLMILDYIEQNNFKNIKILDIGTGSGCIAISLFKELEKKRVNTEVYASDISSNALEVARENAQQNNAQINFVLSDVLNDIPKIKYDIVISNPPYINKNNYVSNRVLENEPHLALYAEEEGLEIYHRIFKDILTFNNNIAMFFEISPDLEEGLQRLAKTYLKGYNINFVKDINDNIRFMIVRKEDLYGN